MVRFYVSAVPDGAECTCCRHQRPESAATVLLLSPRNVFLQRHKYFSGFSEGHHDRLGTRSSVLRSENVRVEGLGGWGLE